MIKMYIDVYIYMRLALVSLGVLGTFEMCVPGDVTLLIGGVLLVFSSFWLYLMAEWCWPTKECVQCYVNPPKS